MVKKRQLAEFVVKEAIEAVCKSGGGHPACPVVSGLMDLYLSMDWEESGDRGTVTAGDRPGQLVSPGGKSAMVDEHEDVEARSGAKVPVSVRSKISRPEQLRDPLTRVIEHQLQGSTHWTDISDFFQEWGPPFIDAAPAIAGAVTASTAAMIARSLGQHVGTHVPVGAGGRLTESIATRVLPGPGQKRRLGAGRSAQSYGWGMDMGL